MGGPMNRLRSWAWLVGVFSLAVTLGACSSDDDDGRTSTGGSGSGGEGGEAENAGAAGRGGPEVSAGAAGEGETKAEPVWNAEYPGDEDAADELSETLCPLAQSENIRTLILPDDSDDVWRVSCD